MAGGALTGFATATRPVGSDYNVMGIADVNNNDYNDQLIQQQSTGLVRWAG
jgi:hypothetical protein